MWRNEEARINSKVANINQLPGTNGFTLYISSKGCGDEYLLVFEGRAEYTRRRKKPIPSGLNLQPFDCRPAL